MPITLEPGDTSLASRAGCWGLSGLRSYQLTVPPGIAALYIDPSLSVPNARIALAAKGWRTTMGPGDCVPVPVGGLSLAVDRAIPGADPQFLNGYTTLLGLTAEEVQAVQASRKSGPAWPMTLLGWRAVTAGVGFLVPTWGLKRLRVSIWPRDAGGADIVTLPANFAATVEVVPHLPTAQDGALAQTTTEFLRQLAGSLGAGKASGLFGTTQFQTNDPTNLTFDVNSQVADVNTGAGGLVWLNPTVLSGTNVADAHLVVEGD